MKDSFVLMLALIGISASLLAGGVTLLFNDSPVSRATGVVLLVTSLALPSLALVYTKFREMAQGNQQALEGLGRLVQTYTDNLERRAKELGLSNDARFVSYGYIGLQRQAMTLESNFETGHDYVRMSILGHLPSHMRRNPLIEDRARILYYNCQPAFYLPEYVDLINQRSQAFLSFLRKGGIVQEIYEKSEIVGYVEKGFTFHDKTVDPLEEIEERLTALLHCLDHPKYFVCFLENKHSGPHYLLKKNVGLVIDLRTVETSRHFTQAMDGLYTDSPPVLEEFERKFTTAWQEADREENKQFVSSLLEKLKENRHAET